MLFSLGFRNMIYSNYPLTNNFQFNTPKINNFIKNDTILKVNKSTQTDIYLNTIPRLDNKTKDDEYVIID